MKGNRVFLDPGMTTGYAITTNDSDLVDFGEKPTYTRLDEFYDWLTELKPSLIVYEEFRLYPGKARALSGNSLFPVMVIGGLGFFAYHHKVKVHVQKPIAAKSLSRQEVIDYFGLDRKVLVGCPHALDALRHTMLFTVKQTGRM